MKDLRDTVITAIANKFSDGGIAVDARDLRDETDLYADCGADELDITDIAMTLEQVLKVELSDDAIDGVRTVGDLVAILKIAQAKVLEGSA